MDGLDFYEENDKKIYYHNLCFEVPNYLKNA